MRIALVHDWLVGMRGGEKCLEALCRLWPDAHLYTLIHRRGGVSPTIERMDIRTSFLQHVPGVFRNYRFLLPLMPIAIESFRLNDYDVVISLSHCVAKSVRVPADVSHLCYCFTPMRYAWHMREAYFGLGPRITNRGSRIASMAVEAVRCYLRTSILHPRSFILADLRRWDRATANRVTQFVAISHTVAGRIGDCYGRESTVIYPPVDTDFYTPGAGPREDFYLCVSALAPYKRIDLAIEACNRLGRRLIVIGEGPQSIRLRAIAGPTVSFLGWQSDETIRDHYRRCRSLLFPGVEDFGIVPLEAQACGAPVIALAAGGATETVIAASPIHLGTGLFFPRQSADSLANAIVRFESGAAQFCPDLARTNAECFRTSRFVEEMQNFVAGTADRTVGHPPQSLPSQVAA
jgi:glycosyltransferase involved in cell wall biosynthesis